MSWADGEALDWTANGPRSRRFDDVYFSASDGLAEARAVFLQGAGLPQAWRDRERFTVAELGFGAGLNIAALLQLWRAERPPGGHLSIFSVEAHPLSRDDAARALAAWPELRAVAEILLAAWPTGRRGAHRIDVPGLHATLDLMIGEAGEALEGWDGAADAWFLDGFAPAKNPGIWRAEVLSLAAARSRPGARAATFTVAGSVRRGLAAAGFQVTRAPGFGRKRERLEATAPGTWAPGAPPDCIVVLGAGIAGASLARAFAALGAACVVLDAAEPGAGASGAEAVMVTPRWDAGLGPVARLHAQAFARAVPLYRAAGAVVREGVLQMEATAKDAARFDRIAGWDGFDPASLSRLSGEEAAAELGEPTAAGALAAADALVVAPARVLRAWLASAEVRPGEACGLRRADRGWAVTDASGATLATADAVCVALGHRTAGLLGGLSLRPVRGQVERTEAAAFSGRPAAWGGYAMPTAAGGVLFGGTHGRGDAGTDLRPPERARNLETLAAGRPALARLVEGLAPEAIQSWAGVRATTPDHLPVAGQIQGMAGVHVLSGLGGRGFTLAPLLAEHVAAVVLGTPSPLPRHLGALLRPDRFAGRA